jgi:large subunit ribosomal protein L9
MQVILTDDVFELGKRGDTVKVADGYGRNYLIPRRLAIPVTPGNLKMIEQQRLAMAKKEAKFKEEAELLAGELNQFHLIISRKAGDAGALFGSVTTKDLADLLQTQGVHIDRRRILLEQPIKTIGNCNVEVRPHGEVSAQLVVSVIAEGDEPVSRAKKKDEESDRIIAELDAKVKEIALLTGARKPEVASVEAASAEGKPRKKSARKRHDEGQAEGQAEPAAESKPAAEPETPPEEA